MDEGIRALIAAFNGQDFQGRYWFWTMPMPISPCNAVDPPELWLSGAEATMRRAQRYGLAWEPSRMAPDEVPPLARAYFDGGGKSLEVRARMSVSKTPEAPQAFRGFSTLAGPAEYLADQINAYAALGASYVSIVPGYDEASCADTIEALGRALPLLR